MKFRNITFSILILLLSISNLSAQFSASSFAGKIDFPTSSSIQGITTGDLNNDNKQDLITANLGSVNTISVFVNNSTQGVINSNLYSTNFTLTTLSLSPVIVLTADLTGDNKQEILVAYSSSSGSQFSIFVNNYNGITFNGSSFTRYDYTAGSSPQGITVADFDRDGKTDVAVANNVSNTIMVFRNTTTSGTLSLATPVSYSTPGGPSSITSGDIDNDGKPEIAVANWGSGNISCYRNTNSIVGTISFATAATYTAQTQPNWIKITDFNNNGLKEVICSNWGSNSISLFENTSGSGISFAPRVDLTISPNQYPQGLGAEDLDGDNKAEIGIAVAGSPVALVFKNVHSLGTILPSSFSGYVAYGANTSPVGFCLTDVDNDQRADMLVGNYSSQNVSVLKNRMLAAEPAVAATNVSLTAGFASITVNCTKGNGSKRLITCRLSTSGAVNPADTSWYTAKDTFGLGSNLGSNNFVVYNDTGSVVTVKGLTMGQTYVFTVYEYNGYGGFSNYYLNNAPVNNISLGDIYFSKSSGQLNLLSTWGTNPDGTGTSPSSFGNSNSVYQIANNSAPSIGANWVVTGTNSFIKIGDGINALNFTIPTGYAAFTDSIILSANGTLTLQGGLTTNKAFFDTLSTVQYIGSAAQNIPGYSFYNLVVAGSTKTLLNNLLVRNSLNMLASIQTSGYLLTLGTSAVQVGTLNRSAGSISGRFRRWFASTTNTGSSGLFPLGSGSNYRPAQVEFTTAPVIAGSLTAEFIGTNPGNIGLPVYDFSIAPMIEINKAANSGYWKLDASGLSGGACVLTLTGAGFHGIVSTPDLRIIKRQTSGAWVTQGTAIAGTGTTANPVVGRIGVLGFGEFTFGGDSTVNPLPVEWLSFEAKVVNKEVLLSWQTVTEKNNKMFLVEYKASGEESFKQIGEVSPKKESGVNQYFFLDQNRNIEPERTYRIRQIDLDGNYSFSAERVVYFDDKTESVFYPNPARTEVHIIAPGNKISLIDIYGKEFPMELVNNKINVQNLPRGVYFLKDETNSGSTLIIE